MAAEAMGNLWMVEHVEEVTSTEPAGGLYSLGAERGRRAEINNRGSTGAVPKIPLGLRQDQIQPLGELAEEYPELKDSLLEMAGNQLSTSTLSNYGTAVKRYKMFCDKYGYEHTEITEKSVIHYAAELNKDKATYSVMCQVKPALTLLEQLNKGKGEAFTDRAERMLEGALRMAATRREPIKKAGEIELEWLQDRVREEIWDKLEKGERVDAYRLRLVFRLAVEYFTLCRLADYQKIRAKHLELIPGGLAVTFPAAKNDQHTTGR